jgi:protocatechuate 3,4-dioxygenase alpha subunit
MTEAITATPGQTVGPFFGYALPYPGGPELVPPAHPDAVRLTGLVLDGDGAPVPDALLEIWQAAPDGSAPRLSGSLRRDGFTFTGWGRAATDNNGRYSFSTLLPGATDTGSAPFIAVTVFARGLLDRLYTRCYLPGHETDWDDDPLLTSLPVDRRRTLIGQALGRELHFDIRLQGENETVFLTYRDRRG